MPRAATRRMESRSEHTRFITMTYRRSAQSRNGIHVDVMKKLPRSNARQGGRSGSLSPRPVVACVHSPPRPTCARKALNVFRKRRHGSTRTQDVTWPAPQTGHNAAGSRVPSSGPGASCTSVFPQQIHHTTYAVSSVTNEFCSHAGLDSTVIDIPQERIDFA